MTGWLSDEWVISTHFDRCVLLCATCPVNSDQGRKVLERRQNTNTLPKARKCWGEILPFIRMHYILLVHAFKVCTYLWQHIIEFFPPSFVSCKTTEYGSTHFSQLKSKWKTNADQIRAKKSLWGTLHKVFGGPCRRSPPCFFILFFCWDTWSLFLSLPLFLNNSMFLIFKRLTQIFQKGSTLMANFCISAQVFLSKSLHLMKATLIHKVYAEINGSILKVLKGSLLCLCTNICKSTHRFTAQS